MSITIKEFIKIADPSMQIKVYDRFGYAGRYTIDELRQQFCSYHYVTDIQAWEYNVLRIKIARL